MVFCGVSQTKSPTAESSAERPRGGGRTRHKTGHEDERADQSKTEIKDNDRQASNKTLKDQEDKEIRQHNTTQDEARQHKTRQTRQDKT